MNKENVNANHLNKNAEKPRYNPSGRGDVKDSKVFWLGFTAIILTIVGSILLVQ